MQQIQQLPYGGIPVAQVSSRERTEFIRKTYAHLFGAILAFMGLEALFFQYLPVNKIVSTMLSGYNWLIVMAAFIFISYIAESWAMKTTSLRKQYLGLGLFVVAEALIFLPILAIAISLGGGMSIIYNAATVTLAIFGGLTIFVFVTKIDFSFLGGILTLLSFGLLGFIVCGFIFGFTMNNGIAACVVALACGYILYDTSNIMRHYQTSQYVAASLALFASVALLFWYILRIFMSRD